MRGVFWEKERGADSEGVMVWPTGSVLTLPGAYKQRMQLKFSLLVLTHHCKWWLDGIQAPGFQFQWW